MGVTCSTHGRDETCKLYIIFVEVSKERNRLEDLEVGAKTILICDII